jgi:RNA polymerase sigma-70 factor (ECF subfamily)
MTMRTEAQIARDAWIAIRCKLGEPDGFRALVDTMERPLLYYITKLTGDPDGAVDVLQQVWIQVFEGFSRLREPAALRTWLYRIARGIALNRIRAETTRRRIERQAADISEMGDEEEPRFDQTDVAALHAGLDRLGEQHREVLVLHFLEELSIAEIAEVVRVPTGTVKSRIHHAKRELRRWLERQGHESNR